MSHDLHRQKLYKTPKPVFPQNSRHHGLIGPSLAKRHMFTDERWSALSLADQFKGMAELLTKRYAFKVLQNKANRKDLLEQYRELKRQCRDGRNKLQMSLYGESFAQIRNALLNHKDMQRLYQRMPPHVVMDNIDQRTFLMRKERDRLNYQLNQMKKVYHDKLLQGGDLENRIKYCNEFVLEEEVKSKKCRAKIEKSAVRLKAIKTINYTYNKMVRVLRNEGIYYESIFQSLLKDLKDQALFIANVLYVGNSAVRHFNELRLVYLNMSAEANKKISRKSSFASSITLQQKPDSRVLSKIEVPKVDKKRYVRESYSMNWLKNELEGIENIIKKVKVTTLCLQAKDLYPHLKMTYDNNLKLNKIIEKSKVGHQYLNLRLKNAELMESLQNNNQTEAEVKRLETIESLNQEIAAQDAIEEGILKYLKNRSDVYVLLRFTLWNLDEILRNIGKNPRITQFNYPNSYLRLPLLKFEMLTMRAVPPEPFQENLDEVLRIIKRKVVSVMDVYKNLDLEEEGIEDPREQYTELIRDSVLRSDLKNKSGLKTRSTTVLPEQEELEVKTLQKIQDHAAIKAQSRKVVEDNSKKED